MKRPRAIQPTPWYDDPGEADLEPGVSGTRRAARRLTPPVDVPAVIAPSASLPRSERPTEPAGGRRRAQTMTRASDAPGAPTGRARPPMEAELSADEVERAERVTSPVPALAATPCSVVDGVTGVPSSSRARPSLRQLATYPRVPRRVRSATLLLNAQLDHTHAFVLTLIDGQIDVETICDVSPLPPEQVFRILDDLVREGLISVD